MTLPVIAAAVKRALIVCATSLAFAGSAWAVSCPVATSHPISEPEQEFLRGHFDRSATLYRAQLQQTPNDITATVGLSRALLRQQKVAEANDVITSAIAIDTTSAALYTALGEVQYREGTPWLTGESVDKALKLDPCYARLHLLVADTLRLSSNYATAAKQLALAHSLDPNDAAIRRSWLDTLPLAARITELETYLASDTGDDAEDLSHLKLYLAALKKRLAEPHKACRLVSDTGATEIPFAPIMRDPSHIRAYGLDVKLNGHNARLQIDTGAGGLLVSRSIADHAHLERYTSEVIGGIGSKGESGSYTAFVDVIKIGSLEFHDCMVRVPDQRRIMDTDGLIGMDTFSKFLVTLDYPSSKLELGPLPKRPDEVLAAKPVLDTEQSKDDLDDADERPAKSEAKATQPGSTAAPANKTVTSLHDRYIAPEMKGWTGVYRVGHDLMLQTSMNDSAPRLFILDTGAFATTVSPAAARSVTKVHNDSTVTVKGVSGEVDKVLSADQIKFHFANMVQAARDVVAFDLSPVSKNVGLEISGFIGATTLNQLTISIDYRDGLVKFVYHADNHPSPTKYK